MRFGSVCSGIEAASVAWEPLGWKAEFFSEIEPFPSAVLAHHYPTVPNYGDMNAFASWPDARLDVLVGGTPCQSFSVAGLRGGMADPRGNLALVYLALADRYRPRWIVWENVPGVLSSSGGRDFGAFLGGLGELGYGWAYRVLDAQHFGVPQRRRRVFVVGYLGDWRRAAAVLFEPASLRRDSAPSREARERIANALTERPDRGGGNSEGQRLVASSTSGNGYWREGIGALRGREQDSHENLVAGTLDSNHGNIRPEAAWTNRLVAPTLSGRTRGGGGLGTDFDCDGGLIAGTLSTTSHDASRDNIGEALITHSLRADGFDASEDGTGEGHTTRRRHAQGELRLWRKVRQTPPDDRLRHDADYPSREPLPAAAGRPMSPGRGFAVPATSKPIAVVGQETYAQGMFEAPRLSRQLPRHSLSREARRRRAALQGAREQHGRAGGALDWRAHRQRGCE
jgi:site-specific DNA-cytosine methylase